MQNALFCQKSVLNDYRRFFIFDDLWQYRSAMRQKMKNLAQKETKRTKMKSPSLPLLSFVRIVNTPNLNQCHTVNAPFRAGQRRVAFAIPKLLISTIVSDNSNGVWGASRCGVQVDTVVRTATSSHEVLTRQRCQKNESRPACRIPKLLISMIISYNSS
jgi:hypothetical protein